MSDLIRINDKLQLSTSGDITNRAGDDFLMNKSFIQFNNNYVNSSYEENKKIIFNLLNKVPSIERILNNALNKTKQLEVVLPKEILKKLHKGDYEWVKSTKSDGLLTAMIREKGSKKFVSQINLKEVFKNTPQQLDNIASSAQMLAIQSSLANISAQLESLDKKLNELSMGAYYDRIAYIQSGYNLFLQAKASEKLRDSLYPIALGQLNMGREQLIYSILNDLDLISKHKVGFGALKESITTHYNIREAQQERVDRVHQSLNFVIRSSQLLSIIYQDYGENWSMVQSVLRLGSVLDQFDTVVFDNLKEWDKKRDTSLIEDDIYSLRVSIKNNVKALIDNPKEIALEYLPINSI